LSALSSSACGVSFPIVPHIPEAQRFAEIERMLRQELESSAPHASQLHSLSTDQQRLRDRQLLDEQLRQQQAEEQLYRERLQELSMQPLLIALCDHPLAISTFVRTRYFCRADLSRFCSLQYFHHNHLVSFDSHRLQVPLLRGRAFSELNADIQLGPSVDLDYLRQHNADFDKTKSLSFSLEVLFSSLLLAPSTSRH
jgi:hypothetical protein